MDKKMLLKTKKKLVALTMASAISLTGCGSEKNNSDEQEWFLVMNYGNIIVYTSDKNIKYSDQYHDGNHWINAYERNESNDGFSHSTVFQIANTPFIEFIGSEEEMLNMANTLIDEDGKISYYIHEPQKAITK